MDLSSRLIGYAGCGAIATGSFLPFRHVAFRDVIALQSGPGVVFLVLAVVAAALIFARRYAGAAFCAIAALFLLGVQYAMMLRITAISSIFWSANGGDNTVVSPVGLNAHPDAGFYVIGIGALAILFAALYGRRSAAVEHVRSGGYAVPERNGHTTIR